MMGYDLYMLNVISRVCSCSTPLLGKCSYNLEAYLSSTPMYLMASNSASSLTSLLYIQYNPRQMKTQLLNWRDLSIIASLRNFRKVDTWGHSQQKLSSSSSSHFRHLHSPSFRSLAGSASFVSYRIIHSNTK